MSAKCAHWAGVGGPFHRHLGSFPRWAVPLSDGVQREVSKKMAGVRRLQVCPQEGQATITCLFRATRPALVITLLGGRRQEWDKSP